MTTGESARGWLAVAAIGCGLLLLSIVVGGAINDGYSHGRDYVSALSGRGSTAAFVGMIGLVGFSSAHVAAGMTFQRISKTATFALIAAGVAGFVVAIARISCPGGAARCSLDQGEGSDALDVVHGLGVGVYQVCFLVGVIAAGVSLTRAPVGGVRRATAALLVALALASAIVVGATPETNPGGVQRLWLAINSLAVLVIAFSGAQAGRALSAGSLA